MRLLINEIGQIMHFTSRRGRIVRQLEDSPWGDAVAHDFVLYSE